jgi:uncharacterized membrane protein (DUF2068 family)
MTVSSTKIAPTRKRHDMGLVLIAAYKLLVALVFAAVGVSALHLVGKDVGDILSNLASDLRFNPEGRFVNFVLDKASLLNDPMLRRIGFAAFCLSAVSIVEGIGLYLEKVWAEYLTLAITASFLPLEVRELIHRFTWVRVAIFVINLAVLIYLAMVVLERHRKRNQAVTAASE